MRSTVTETHNIKLDEFNSDINSILIKIKLRSSIACY